MKWTEIEIKIPSQRYEITYGILTKMDITNVSVYDAADIDEKNRVTAGWDYIEEDLLHLDRDVISIKAYLIESIDISKVLEELRKNISEVEDFGEYLINTNILDEEDWANNWKAYYKPVEIGKRIVIKPTWETINFDSSGKEIIEMDPGMAFGTGTHETTQMCIEALEDLMDDSPSVLDVGTGSGILGIAAVKLGAKECLGVDIDENAVRIANENAVENKVSDKFKGVCGNLIDKVEKKYDIVVANIIADAIIMLSAQVRTVIDENGLFIASGIINSREDDVLKALEEANFKTVETHYLGDWVCIVSSPKLV